MIKHVMCKINLILLLGKGIAKGSSLPRFAPMPIHKIVADSRTETTNAVLGGKDKGQCPARRPLHAKGPIKPIALGIANIAFQINGVAIYAVKYDIAACKIAVYLHGR